jgi:hypothetical protein
MVETKKYIYTETSWEIVTWNIETLISRKQVVRKASN